MKYQLAAFDMDGTLLTSDKRILPETLEAIREADKAGKYIALCTG
ncbi:MAG: HAD hydrolase family protein, partial [Lachnospiraceae bacterium]|nr:HAD hydrolase family protein [Lachnospiraceae bacterium]